MMTSFYKLLLKEKRPDHSRLGESAVAMMHDTRLQSRGLGGTAA
jgi:hypothetical protein